MRTAGLYIILLGIALILCSADSCESTDEASVADEEGLVSARIDSVKSYLVSDGLTSVSLRAFEVKAKQKLLDLSDYLSLYSDPTLSSAFKGTIAELTKGLVISDSILILCPVSPIGNFESVPLAAFLDSSSVVIPFEIQLDSIEIQQHPQRSGDQAYSGVLSFIVSYQLNSFPGVVTPGNQYRQQQFFVMKTASNAIDTLGTWKVVLGDVIDK